MKMTLKIALNLLIVFFVSDLFAAFPVERVNNPIKSLEVISDMEIKDSFSVLSKDKLKNREDKKALKKKIKDAKKALLSGGDKTQIATFLLCFFLGPLGIHSFYLGNTTKGIIQLLTFGGLGVWAFIDLIRIIIGDLGPGW